MTPAPTASTADGREHTNDAPPRASTSTFAPASASGSSSALPAHPTLAPPLPGIIPPGTRFTQSLHEHLIYLDRQSNTWRCEAGEENARQGILELEWRSATVLPSAGSSSSSSVSASERQEEQSDELSTTSRREGHGRWVPVLDEEVLRQQQAAYGVAGVDEETPAAPIARRLAKRGANADQGDAADGESSRVGKARKVGEAKGKGKAQAKAPRAVTAVYVTGLPLDTSVSEIAQVFGRYGVLSEDNEGNARIKLYTTDQGAQKGEALVSYFKAESVELAIRVLDESCLRAAQGKTSPVMSVQKAEFGNAEVSGTAGEAGVAAAAAAAAAAAKEEASTDKPAKKPVRSEAEKKQAAKRYAKLNGKLTDWDSDEDDFGPKGAQERPSGASSSTQSRIVILLRMFTLAELDEDPTLLLDLKEDVREECETIGKVTNCVLYDKEPEGIMSVKFATPAAAVACVQKMDGRFFSGRTVIAYLADSKPKFRRSGVGEGSDEEEEEEGRRADAFGEWLDQGGG
ncbi:Transcription elongation factor TAT-SF1 [Ceraceosorus bombacis]|uniref:Transcription elongation factor TAT-SF1 n=1 Tax=Ceraceosorus bombacis TaxID=401625 RepID=A0A0P1BJR7_9BASI|nr:Transcription elongation factor TAT-SF1 [Ceraceosorus bombacis]